MNIHAAAAYATHLLTARSTAGHGVHSPLMFRFITEVIGGRADKHIIEEVRRLRREMLSDSRLVRVTDLGAGSTVIKEGERNIRQIASVAALPARETALLARIAASLDSILERVPDHKTGGPQHTPRPEIARESVVLPVHELEPTGRAEKDHEPNGRPSHELELTGRAEKDHEPNGRPSQGPEPTDQAANNLENTPPGEMLKPDNHPVILELGTSLGISTLALALAAPHSRVITVEGCPELAAIASENLRRHGASNAEVLHMEFSQAITHLKEQGIKVSMAFIDGNHRGAAMTDYIFIIREMGDQMIIVADDIHMNCDMHEAWQALTASSFTIASIETLRLGILFCLHNLTPGHYRIRY